MITTDALFKKCILKPYQKQSCSVIIEMIVNHEIIS